MNKTIRTLQNTNEKLFKLLSTLKVGDSSIITSRDKASALKVVSYYSRRAACEGRNSMSHVKNINLVFVRLLMGLEPNHKPDCTIPRYMWNWYRDVKDSHILRRVYFITVLSSYKVLKFNVDYKLDTIESPYTGLSIYRLWVKYHSAIKSAINSFVSSGLTSTVDDIYILKWHISGSASPNGKVSWKQFQKDIYALALDWRLSRWLVMLSLSLPISEKKELRSKVFDAYKFGASQRITNKWTEKVSHSKLAFLSDKGGKTRVVAIYDIVSQTLLKPIHSLFFKLLKRFKTDGTFDQDVQRQRVHNWVSKGNFASSVDMTACTDRMPRLLQAFVIYRTKCLSLVQTISWLGVMADRSFDFTRKRKRKGKPIPGKVRYRVGQPMGALSSWAVMAYTHHFLVQVAYKVVRLKSGYSLRKNHLFDDYALLGDDIVIFNSKVSEVYKEILTDLGMEYSPHKTLEGQGVAEFAKSLYRRSENLTPFPLGPLTSEYNTLVSDAFVSIESLKRFIPLRPSISLFASAFTVEYKWIVIGGLLSTGKYHSYFDLPRDQRTIDNFENYLLSKRLPSYVREYRKMIDSYGNLPLGWERTPFAQIAWDGVMQTPPGFHNVGDLHFYYVTVGDGWIAYNANAWPAGLPGDWRRDLIPKPSWELRLDDLIVRSAVQQFGMLIPNVFWPRCHSYWDIRTE